MGLRMKTILFILFFSRFALAASDYMIQVLSVYPQNNMHNSLMYLSNCSSLFGSKASEQKKEEQFLHLQQIANYSYENETRDDKNRGSRMQQIGLSAKQIRESQESILEQTLHDWLKSGDYTREQIEDLRKQHAQLDPNRIHFISIQDLDENGIMNYYSSIRIYDSSVVPKINSKKHFAQKNPNIKSQVELNFPNVDLEQILETAGIEKATNTWNIGLIDIIKPYPDAIKSLLAQTADLLDLHYNDRMYFEEKSTESIERDEVDIVFYANERIKSYYERLFGIIPLKNSKGQNIILSKESGNYYLFHMTGSYFIRKFFQIQYYEPSFASNLNLRKQKETYEYMQSLLKQSLDRLDARHYVANSKQQMIEVLIRILYESQNKSISMMDHIAKLIYLRRSLPHSMTAKTSPEQDLKDLELTKLLLQKYNLSSSYNQGNIAAAIALSNVMLTDPLLFIINRSTLNK